MHLILDIELRKTVKYKIFIAKLCVYAISINKFWSVTGKILYFLSNETILHLSLKYSLSSIILQIGPVNNLSIIPKHGSQPDK